MKATGTQWGDYTRDAPAVNTRIGPAGWLEVLLLSGLAAVLSTVSSYFAEWPALASIPLGFSALRHGSSSAVLGSLIWIMFCSVLQLLLGLPPEPLALEHLGPILIALLCGYFSDTWHERLTAMESARRNQGRLLEQLSNGHHLLQLSHARLEQRVIGGVDNLRESLQRLHDSLDVDAQQRVPLESQAQDILLQFDSLTWIQSAALYLVDGELSDDQTPAAEMGEPPVPEALDPMLHEVVRQRKMLAVTDIRSSAKPQSPIAAAPIVDHTGCVRAVVCVYKVPFLSFNRENLALMAVLAAHIGYMISTAERINADDNRANLERQLTLACEDADKFNLPSVLVQWTFHPSQTSTTAAKYIRDNVRGLDFPLLQIGADSTRLTLLCLLTDKSEFEQMHERLEELLAVRYAIDLKANLIDHRVIAVDGGVSPAGLLNMIELHTDV